MLNVENGKDVQKIVCNDARAERTWMIIHDPVHLESKDVGE